MTWQTGLMGFVAGLVISLVTAPVGVSGAVFLLPVQLSVLHVPNPAVTPTNLLFNVVSGPGALARYRRHGGLAGPLTRLLLTGTLPGVVLGALIRVFAVPGPRLFRLVVAAVLLPLGVWLCLRAVRPAALPARRFGHRPGPALPRPGRPMNPDPASGVGRGEVADRWLRRAAHLHPPM
jgi:uncharacterized membrane protein YfcA